jgi:hypothetical protein
LQPRPLSSRRPTRRPSRGEDTGAYVVAPGFIVNRCARPFYAEGLRLLAERAADAASLDAVIRDAGGFRMGPFELIDLIGLDVNLAVTTSIWEAYFHDPRYAPSVLQRERVSAGFLGRKSGRGFYDYTPGTTKPEAHAEPKRPAPARIAVHGELGSASALVERMASGGVAVERARIRAFRRRHPHRRGRRWRVDCAHRRTHRDHARRRDRCPRSGAPRFRAGLRRGDAPRRCA